MLPSFSRRFHFIRYSDVFRPDIELPFSNADQTAQDFPRVHTNSHINIQGALFSGKIYYF